MQLKIRKTHKKKTRKTPWPSTETA